MLIDISHRINIIVDNCGLHINYITLQKLQKIKFNHVSCITNVRYKLYIIVFYLFIHTVV